MAILPDKDSAKHLLDPVAAELERVDSVLQQASLVPYEPLRDTLQPILTARGKRLRPALVLLAARQKHYDPSVLVPAAAAVELLHTATLVHDDMLDGASVRRGVTTVNQECGDRASVLVGDYLFAKAADLAADTNNVEVMHVFSRALMTIADGQLQEMFVTDAPDGIMPAYLRRIGAKTASLFETSSQVGAILGGTSPLITQALRLYGYSLGMAFQVVDDILDFIGYAEDLGKPVGGDLRQGTVTLPAILLLQLYPENNPVQAIVDGDGDLEENVARAISMVRGSEVLGLCVKQARDYGEQAKGALAVLTDNAYKRTMLDLADYIVSRAAP